MEKHQSSLPNKLAKSEVAFLRGERLADCSSEVWPFGCDRFWDSLSSVCNEEL